MAFKDYSNTPADNTALGDGTYIGPDMLRNKVRPALQQIASDGKDLADTVQDRIDLAKGDPGGDGSLMPKFTIITASVDIPSDIELVQTVGYDATDLGSAVYVYDATVDAAYVTAHPTSSFLANDSRGFRLSLEQDLTPQMLGAAADGVADDSTAFQAAVDLLPSGGGKIAVPYGTYKLLTQPVLGSKVIDWEISPGATFTGAGTGAGKFPGNAIPNYRMGPATPVAGVSLAIDWRSSDGATDAPALGVAWPLGAGYIGRTREKRYTTTNAPGGANTAPAVAGLDYAEAAGTLQDVVAHMAVSYAMADNSTVFAGNDIIFGLAGLTGVRGVVREFDLQLSAVPTSGSLIQAMNVFSVAVLGNATQLNGLFGGSISNGHVVYGPVTGAALAGGAGGSCGQLTNTGTCAYLNSIAHIVSNGHKFQHSGTVSTHWLTYCHSNDDLRVKFGSGLYVWRNAADAANVAAMNAGGALALGANASTSAGYKLDVASDVTTEAGGLADFKNSAGSIAVEILIATGANGNAANTAIRARASSVTSRSINAGGTINASGADYAEYERKADGVTDIIKGAVVGFTSDGLLTDRFADSVRFGVKSTNPNLVGGDDWADHLPAAPAPPTFEPPAYDGIEDPGPTWPISDATEEEVDALAAVAAARQAKDEEALAAARQSLQTMRDERAARDAALYAEWEAAKAQREVDVAAHDEAVEQARGQWEATTWAEYEGALASHNELLDETRQPYDRIAYCGKVPLNLAGATPGQWVIVSASGSGGIQPLALDYAATTQEQRDLFCIGRVNRVLDDGRAEIVVRT